MILGNLCSLTTWSKKMAATRDAYEVLKHEMKWAILDNLSTTIRIKSCLFSGFSNPSIKSKLTSCQGQLGIERECKDRPYVFVAWPVNKCDIDQQSQQRLSSSSASKNLCPTISIILFWLKRPARPPACNDQGRKSLRDVHEIHSLWNLNKYLSCNRNPSISLTDLFRNVIYLSPKSGHDSYPSFNLSNPVIFALIATNIINRRLSASTTLFSTLVLCLRTNMWS